MKRHTILDVKRVLQAVCDCPPLCKDSDAVVVNAKLLQQIAEILKGWDQRGLGGF